MATLRYRTRKRDGVVVGEVRFYPREGAPQVSVTVEGELTAKRYREAVERALRDGAPIPPAPGHRRVPVESAPMTVGDFFLGPYMTRHWPGLAAATQDKYRSCWNVHVTHREYGIAERPLTELDADPTIVQGFKNAMRDASVGKATINNTLGLLGSIFTQAVRTPGSGMRHHPIRNGVVEYESQLPDEAPLPHPPLAAGMVCAAMPDWSGLDEQGSRLYLMTMTCCGLRPGEARALRVRDIREHTLFIHAAIDAKGRVAETKNQKWKYPPVPEFLRDALHEYADGREFVWPTMHSENAHRDWGKNVLIPARANVASEQRERWPDLGRTTAYDLGRHSFAAVYLRGGWWEGYKRRELADWMGHTVRTLELHYGNLIAEYQHAAPVAPLAELTAGWKAANGSAA